jgi:hypothetical protein
VFGVEYHTEKSWKKGLFNLTEFLECKIRGAESFEAKESLMEELIFVVLTGDS